MANSHGLIQHATLMSFEILQRLTYKLPMLTQFAHTFSQNLKLGQKVHISDVGEGSVRTFSTSTGYQADLNRTDTDYQVTVDKWKYYTQSWAADDLHKSERDLIAEEGDRGAYVLGRSIIDDVLTLLTGYAAGSRIGITPTAPDFDHDDALDVWKAFEANGVPGPYFGVLNAAAARSLLGDATILNTRTNPGNNSLQTGNLMPIAGIDWSVYGGLPTQYFASNEEIFGFACNRDAILFAGGAPRDVSEIAGIEFPKNYITRVVTDPNTGLSLRWLAFMDGQAQTFEIHYAMMYGYLEGKESLMRVLHDTA